MAARTLAERAAAVLYVPAVALERLAGRDVDFAVVLSEVRRRYGEAAFAFARGAWRDDSMGFGGDRADGCGK